MITDTDMAKSINDALEHDFPSAKLGHKVDTGLPGKPKPTTSEQITATIGELQTLIRVLEEVKKRL
jgi:hypothetical protein